MNENMAVGLAIVFMVVLLVGVFIWGYLEDKFDKANNLDTLIHHGVYRKWQYKRDGGEWAVKMPDEDVWRPWYEAEERWKLLEDKKKHEQLNVAYEPPKQLATVSELFND